MKEGNGVRTRSRNREDRAITTIGATAISRPVQGGAVGGEGQAAVRLTPIGCLNRKGVKEENGVRTRSRNREDRAKVVSTAQFSHPVQGGLVGGEGQAAGIRIFPIVCPTRKGVNGGARGVRIRSVNIRSNLEYRTTSVLTTGVAPPQICHPVQGGAVGGEGQIAVRVTPIAIRSRKIVKVGNAVRALSRNLEDRTSATSIGACDYAAFISHPVQVVAVGGAGQVADRTRPTCGGCLISRKGVKGDNGVRTRRRQSIFMNLEDRATTSSIASGVISFAHRHPVQVVAR